MNGVPVIVPVIEATLSAIEKLSALIPKLIAQAKAKGELTPEQEADYQRRQEETFRKPYAQPEVLPGGVSEGLTEKTDPPLSPPG